MYRARADYYVVKNNNAAIGSNTVPRGALEVIEYVPRQVTEDAVSPDYSRESKDFRSRLRLEHRTLSSCAAALTAFALHALLVAPLLWAGGASQSVLDHRYRGEPAMQWVVLADSTDRPAVRSRALPAPTLMAVGVTDAQQLPSVAVSGGGQADGQSGLGQMYGRYVGQIRARIDRAWLRPRTAIGAPIFQCQVQIDQDRGGRVREITLLECNGDSRWQLSLVHAIEAASPLPAPPDPAVFAQHVLLAFRAAAYSTGAPAQLYEQPSALPADDVAAQPEASSQNAFRVLREAAQAPHSQQIIELRIEGSSIKVEPEHQ